MEKEVPIQDISELELDFEVVKNFEAYDTFEDRRAIDSSPPKSGGIRMLYQRLCMPHSTVLSTERHSSGEWTLRSSWHF